LKGSEQIFASQYRLVLPSEDELREAIEQERAAWEEIEPLARKSFPRET